MARCRSCKKSGLLFQVNPNGVCRECAENISFNVQQVWSVIQDLIETAEKAGSINLIIAYMNMAIMYVNDLTKYDIYKIFNFSFSDFYFEMRRKKQSMIFSYYKSVKKDNSENPEYASEFQNTEINSQSSASHLNSLISDLMTTTQDQQNEIKSLKNKLLASQMLTTPVRVKLRQRLKLFNYAGRVT